MYRENSLKKITNLNSYWCLDFWFWCFCYVHLFACSKRSGIKSSRESYIYIYVWCPQKRMQNNSEGQHLELNHFDISVLYFILSFHFFSVLYRKRCYRSIMMWWRSMMWWCDDMMWWRSMFNGKWNVLNVFIWCSIWREIWIQFIIEMQLVSIRCLN